MLLILILKFGSHTQEKQTMRTKDEINEERILKQYNNLIMKLSYNCYKNYRGKYCIEDLVQEAKLGVLKAIRNYDPSKNVKLITHLHNYINYYLSHYIRRDNGLIKVPRPKKDEQIIIPEFIDNEIFQNNYINEKCSEKQNIEENTEKQIMFENFLSILTEREREILRLAFVERYTYAEIAKIYDVSRQYANTTANKALKKIKNQFFQP